MNDKFWDVKIEKQNRIINAALKIFARSGFAHASTDDIVAEAGISKGLLFHYFISKAGLYEFLIEYSARYRLLEIQSHAKDRLAGFLDLQRYFVDIDAAIMDQYPYMTAFLDRTYKELGSPSFLKEFPESAEILRHLQAAGYEMYSTSGLPADVHAKEAETILSMLSFVRSGILEHMQLLSQADSSKYREEMYRYIDVLQKLMQP